MGILTARVIDRLGKGIRTAPRDVLVSAGYLLFSVVYLGFAFAEKAGAFIMIFILYGIFTAMTAGVERALIAEIAPARLKGTMLGLHSTIAGIALLPASIICGVLWECFGSAVPFFGKADKTVK